MPGFTAESISSLPGFSSVAPDARVAQAAASTYLFDTTVCAAPVRTGSELARASVRPTGAFYFPLKVVAPTRTIQPLPPPTK